MLGIATHTLVSIVSMIGLYYFLGYGTGGLSNILKLNYVDGDSIRYKGELLSSYDENCSVIVEKEFQLIKLYCDSYLGEKVLFRQWERGISFQPPPQESTVTRINTVNMERKRKALLNK